MEEQSISLNLNNNIFSICDKRNCRSKVWGTFGEIKNQNGDTIPNFVACRSCKKVMKNFKTTTNLLRHRCFKETLPNINKEVIVSMADKKAVFDVSVKLCIEDIRPFSTVEGSGMQAFVKECIKIGAKYGEHVNVKDMLPTGTTISNNVKNIKDKLVEIVKTELGFIKNFSATTDLWTDSFKMRSYLALTIHYIINESLFERVLAVDEIEAPLSGENIFDKIKTIFLDYGITDNINYVRFVTDRGSNVIKALENNLRFNCFGHLLHNVLEKASAETPQMKHFFEECKHIKS